MHYAIISILILATAGPACAQHDRSGYAGMQDRAIAALSPEQVADLQEGRGMGASLPAELNGVPGPLHVLEMKDRLDLTLPQQAAIERIFGSMKSQATRLGREIIEAETALDLAFKQSTANEEAIRSYASTIAALNGRLRAVHLVAHLETKRLLSSQQVRGYMHARGYETSD
ncbi:MAG: hypothetical protein V4787_03530 [Pseudomonadota bacterium]